MRPCTTSLLYCVCIYHAFCACCVPLVRRSRHVEVVRHALQILGRAAHRSSSDIPAARKWTRFCLLFGIPYMLSSSRLRTTTTKTQESIRYTPLPCFSLWGYGSSLRGTSILGTGLYRSALLSQRCVYVLNLCCVLPLKSYPTGRITVLDISNATKRVLGSTSRRP